MIANRLPSVLQHSRGSISMERALKQIKGLLETLRSKDWREEDRVNASLDDIETMLDKIDRSE